MWYRIRALLQIKAIKRRRRSAERAVRAAIYNVKVSLNLRLTFLFSFAEGAFIQTPLNRGLYFGDNPPIAVINSNLHNGNVNTLYY